MAQLILMIIIGIIAVLVMRLLGAWMLRINDVIDHLKVITQELNKLNKK